MNILFLTLAKINSIEDRGIYPDLMRKFRDEGHKLIIVTPNERRYRSNTKVYNDFEATILSVWTPNILKTHLFEKLIGTMLVNYLFKKAINKYFPVLNIDLIIYSTPPITFNNLIKYLKRKTGACTYLLLKDIFPQNAVDLGMINNKGLIYKYFRNMEVGLYKISDTIGCMSLGNIDYLITHNNSILNNKHIHLNPNSIDLNKISKSDLNVVETKLRYNIPINSLVIIYGGNLGKPQGLDFLNKLLIFEKNNHSIFFLIIGSGTEYQKIKNCINKEELTNSILLDSLSVEEFDKLVRCSDVGLVLLDNRFTIPNIPSRILSYTSYSKPILLLTDKATDLQEIVVKNNFGLWSEHGNLIEAHNNIQYLIENEIDRVRMGINSYNYMINNLLVDNSYNAIINSYRILNKKNV